MKATLWVGVVTLVLLALPGHTRAACWPCGGGCAPCGGGCAPCISFGPHVQLGPWYHYYPYDAHFQMPAPVGPFPNWQSPVAGMSEGPALSAPPAAAPVPWQPPTPQPAVQPTGYVQPAAYYQQVPSYWYGQR
jgi:hypothetical protein